MVVAPIATLYALLYCFDYRKYKAFILSFALSHLMRLFSPQTIFNLILDEMAHIVICILLFALPKCDNYNRPSSVLLLIVFHCVHLRHLRNLKGSFLCSQPTSNEDTKEMSKMKIENFLKATSKRLIWRL